LILAAHAIKGEKGVQKCSSQSQCGSNQCCQSSGRSLSSGSCAPLGSAGSACQIETAGVTRGPTFATCPCAEGLYCKPTPGTAVGVCTQRVSDTHGCPSGETECTRALAQSTGCTVGTCYQTCGNGYLKCTEALHALIGCTIGKCVVPCPKLSLKCTTRLAAVDGCRVGTCMSPCPEGKVRCTVALHAQVNCALGTCVAPPRTNACEPNPCPVDETCVPEDNNFCDNPPCHSCQEPNACPCHPNPCPRGEVCQETFVGIGYTCHAT